MAMIIPIIIIPWLNGRRWKRPALSSCLLQEYDMQMKFLLGLESVAITGPLLGQKAIPSIVRICINYILLKEK